MVVSWTTEDGSSVHRVVTRRLQVCRSRAAALRAVDGETGALLLAKRIVQEAVLADAAALPKEAERIRGAIGSCLFSLLPLTITLSQRHLLPCTYLSGPSFRVGSPVSVCTLDDMARLHHSMYRSTWHALF